MQVKDHWQNVYSIKNTTEVSWFQPHAQLSLKFIESLVTDTTASIIDIGGGASTLVDDLLTHNYHNISVLDLSSAALTLTKNRLATRAESVHWLEANILETELAQHAYDVWHDRAVFHFLTTPEQQQAYIKQVSHALKPDGLLIISTFASDGPLKCSGLPVVRYTTSELYSQFSDSFELINSKLESHITPVGKEQKFIYIVCRKIN